MSKGMLAGILTVGALLAGPSAAAAENVITVGASPNYSYVSPVMRLHGELPGGFKCDPPSSSNTSTPVTGVFDWGESATRLTRQESHEHCANTRQFTGSILLSDLWAGSTYFYRAGMRGYPERNGEVRSFVAPDASPWVEEGWTSEVDDTAVTFRGAIADSGALTTWRVRFWAESAPGTTWLTQTRTMSGDGGEPEDVAEPVTGLRPGTRYAFRFVAENSVGVTEGPVATFTTSSARPQVTMLPPTGIGPDRARIRALVDPNGNPTDWGVRWNAVGWPLDSPRYSFGPLDGFDPVEVMVDVSGFEPETGY